MRNQKGYVAPADSNRLLGTGAREMSGPPIPAVRSPAHLGLIQQAHLRAASAPGWSPAWLPVTGSTASRYPGARRAASRRTTASTVIHSRYPPRPIRSYTPFSGVGRFAPTSFFCVAVSRPPTVIATSEAIE